MRLIIERCYVLVNIEKKNLVSIWTEALPKEDLSDIILDVLKIRCSFPTSRRSQGGVRSIESETEPI